MRNSTLGRLTTIAWLLAAIRMMGVPSEVSAGAITLSGTVTYGGVYAGDSLYVVALDTTATKDVTILDVQVIAVGPLPTFSEAYSLTFDNAGVAPSIFVASFLDVDGGGLAEISGADVFGWYDGNAIPVGVSTASSQSGLDFDLPRAEIHGTITLAPRSSTPGSTCRRMSRA